MARGSSSSGTSPTRARPGGSTAKWATPAVSAVSGRLTQVTASCHTTRVPALLEVSQRLVLFEGGRSGGDVTDLRLEFLHQWLHGRLVWTRIPHADGQDRVRLAPGREVGMAESRHLRHLGSPERLPPSR